jgi:intein/homing endonuclease
MSIAEICANMTSDEGVDTSKILHKDAMEFITAPWGLGMGTVPGVPSLYPSQRFIIKMYYGLELDDGPNRDIIVNDQFNEEEIYRFNEKEYRDYLFSEGRVNKETDGNWFTDLTLVIGRRGGKCVVGDSLVLTDRGIYNIEELGKAEEDNVSPVDFTVSQEYGKRSKATKFYNGGVRDTFRIKTFPGYEVTGTGNHRIRVLDNNGRVVWKFLDQIKPGDYVAINRSTDLWANDYLNLKKFHNDKGRKEVNLPDILDEKFANLIGYLVGDGNWTLNNGIAVTIEHDETWEHVYKLLYDIFGMPKKKLDIRTENTGFLAFYSVKVKAFMESIGYISDDRYSKKVPWSILRSPKKVVRSFLRGLFETDGCVESGGRRITFSSASFDLSKEVQVLLLNMGILSTVRKKWVKKTKRHYAKLEILGTRSKKLFAKLIGFDSEKKNKPLNSYFFIEGKSSTETIPNQHNNLRELLHSVPKNKQNQGHNRQLLREAIGNTIKFSSNENITYNRLINSIKIAKQINADPEKIKFFEDLIKKDYYYAKVEFVELSEDQVYDLVVPDGVSFVANGITNHNTMLTSCIISYELYKLLSYYCPQEFYGIVPESEIRVTCVATSKETAGELFNAITGNLERSEFFRKFRGKPTKQSMSLRTQRDLDKYGENGRATLSIHVAPCSAKGLRGHNNIIVALDEMAFFFEDEKKEGKGSASDRNDRAIFKAVTPSVAKFQGKDGKPHGKIICISSPNTKSGKFYELYENSFEETNKNQLMIQAPTWELDSNLSSEFLHNEYNSSRSNFSVEYGAQFSDRVKAWIEDPTIVRQNIVPGLAYIRRSSNRIPHFMGIDIGLKEDGTAVCICHHEEELINGVRENLIQVDECQVRFAQDEGKKHFTPQELADWLHSFTNNFFIVKALMDQYYGMGIIPLLEDKGLRQFEYRIFTETLNSQIYQNLLTQLISSNIRLPEEERVIDGRIEKDSALVQELLTLQAYQKSKYIVKVEAPDRKNAHDDRSDAFARAVLLATEYKSRGGGAKVSASRSPRAHGHALMRSIEKRKIDLNRPSRGRMPSRMGRGVSSLGIRR